MKNNNPTHQLWCPPRDWENQDAFLVGGGPSLSKFDFSLLKGRNVIGCNDAFHLGADIVKYCLFGDPSWWHHNKWKLEQFSNPVVTNAPGCLPFKVANLLKMTRERDGLHSGTTLGWNYSTGAAAINLAISLGATRLFLLGYDLRNEGKVSHWHKHNQKVIGDYAFHRFLNGFARVKKDLPGNVSVLNVTDGSTNLHCFDKVSFAHFYALIAPLPALGSELSATSTPDQPLKTQAGQPEGTERALAQL